MPKLVSASGPVIAAAPGAHHYRFVGVEIAPRDGVFLKNLVELGVGASSLDSLPHHLVFERCYVHGDRVLGARRGIALNARDVLGGRLATSPTSRRSAPTRRPLRAGTGRARSAS